MTSGALYLNGTTSQQVSAIPGKVYGVIVNSHTSGTIKLWDSLTAANNVIVNTYTLSAGSQVIRFPEPVVFNTGLFITVGGTIDYTVISN